MFCSDITKGVNDEVLEGRAVLSLGTKDLLCPTLVKMGNADRFAMLRAEVSPVSHSDFAVTASTQVRAL